MIDRKLAPGMYLIGRDDGLVDAFFARITHEHVLEHNIDCRIARQALTHAGWWWRRMVIPRFCPDDAGLEKLPPFPKLRGDE